MGEYDVSDGGGIIGKSDQSPAEIRMVRNQAIKPLELQLLTLEQSLGEHHPDAIRARHQLAHAYRAANDFVEALVLFERNVAAGIRVYGPQNLFTLRMRSHCFKKFCEAGKLLWEPTIPIRCAAGAAWPTATESPAAVRTPSTCIGIRWNRGNECWAPITPAPRPAAGIWRQP